MKANKTSQLYVNGNSQITFLKLFIYLFSIQEIMAVLLIC